MPFWNHVTVTPFPCATTTTLFPANVACCTSSFFPSAWLLRGNPGAPLASFHKHAFRRVLHGLGQAFFIRHHKMAADECGNRFLYKTSLPQATGQTSQTCFHVLLFSHLFVLVYIYVNTQPIIYKSLPMNLSMIGWLLGCNSCDGIWTQIMVIPIL